jgi:hypothetical protein
MLIALTLMDLSCALVRVDILEMELFAKVNEQSDFSIPLNKMIAYINKE